MQTELVQQNKKMYSGIFAILLLAFLVRLLGIVSRPIWYDEAFSILFSEKGLGQMLYGTLTPTGAGSADIHPLGYYTILWLWMKTFGESLVAVRLLSIFAGLGIVYLIFEITNQLFDLKTAHTAAMITSVAPFQVHFAQEIRMYAFLAFWLLLTVYFFLRGSRTGNWRWWIGFAVTSALAQYTHNLAAFFLVPLAITPFYKKDWKTVKAVFAAGFLALLLYLPWLIEVPAQFAKVNQAYWVTKPDLSRLFSLFLYFTTNLPLPASWIPIGLLCSLLIISFGFLQSFYNKGTTAFPEAIWVLYLTFAPPGLLFLFSQWKPVYIERALLPSGAFFCIWLAWVLQKTRMNKLAQVFLAFLLATLFIMGIFQHITYNDFPYGSFKDINVYIANHRDRGDSVIHSNKLSFLPALYYDRNLTHLFIGDPLGSSTDTLAASTQDVLKIQAEKDIETASSGADRIWYIIYQRSIDEYTQTGALTHPDIEYLNTQYTLITKEHFGNVVVLLFKKKS